MRARVSGDPNAFQVSACVATIRSVFRSPEPPITIGRWAWRGGGEMRRPSNAYRPPGGLVTSPPSSSVRTAGTASASQSRRWPNPVPNSNPNAVCSRSNQAAPRPSIARPSLMWSMVVTALATRPGLRKVLAPTNRPSLARLVAWATAASAV